MPSSAPAHLPPHSSPTRRSSDLKDSRIASANASAAAGLCAPSRTTVGCRCTISSRPAHDTPANASATASWSSRSSVRASKATTAADRKSTRLNSSHRTISYAVFCPRPPPSTLFPYTTLFRSEGLTYRIRQRLGGGGIVRAVEDDRGMPLHDLEPPGP